jgi:hypothetical protein
VLLIDKKNLSAFKTVGGVSLAHRARVKMEKSNQRKKRKKKQPQLVEQAVWESNGNS